VYKPHYFLKKIIAHEFSIAVSTTYEKVGAPRFWVACAAASSAHGHIQA
jgi:hypothetical protein